MSSDLKYLPVSDIIQTDKKLRDVDKESDYFKDLVESVRENGVINSINVRVMPDGSYELIDGKHRLNAAMEAELDTIPCQIFDNVDEKKQLELQIVGNVHRADTKPAAYAKQLRRLMGLDPSITIPQLAKDLSRSTVWLNNLLKLDKLRPEIQEYVDDGRLKLLSAYNLADIPEAEQLDWLEDALSSPVEEFVPRVSARVKEIKDLNRKGKSNEEATFEPTPKLRKKNEIEEAISNNTFGAKGTEALKWAISMDPDTVKASEQAWEEAKANREKRAQERKEARAKEKLEAAKKEVAELQEKVK